MKVHFITPSIINPLSWSLVGVSAKPNSSNPIGKFGTGLKYAIAICVRNGWPIKAVTNSGDAVKVYHFGSTKADFRGNEHDIVTCNDEKLPFTTHYGNHWENWTVLRELYSNTIDENGFMEITGSDENVKIPEGCTAFVIESEDIAEFAKNIEEYILGETSKQSVVYENNDIQILGSRYEGKVFYRNILVGKMESTKFGYNILGELTLTEDRTFQSEYQVQRRIVESILQTEYEESKKEFMLAGSWSENNFYCADWITPCESMIDAIKRFNASNPHTLLNCLKAFLPKLERNNYNEIEFSVTQQKMLDAALASMLNCGLPIFNDIKCVEIDDNELIAFVDRKNQKCVYLTERAFKSQDYLISTLMEEFSHILGYHDESRTYEQYLCETISKLIWLIENK